MAWVENFQHRFKKAAKTDQALIAGDLTLKGEIMLTGAGAVATQIDGSLTSTHHLTINADARITGPCQAANLHVSGHVTGDLQATKHIRLEPGSTVQGHVRSNSLDITPQGDFEGSLEIGIPRPE